MVSIQSWVNGLMDLDIYQQNYYLMPYSLSGETRISFKIEVTNLEFWCGIILVMVSIQSWVYGLGHFSGKLLFDALFSPRTDQDFHLK